MAREPAAPARRATRGSRPAYLHLQTAGPRQHLDRTAKDLGLAPGLVATPIFFANLGLFLSTCGWGWWADRFGRRSAIIIPALIALPLAPFYLLSSNFLWVAVGFIAQGMCAGGGMQGQMAPYLNERFPTEVRATASAFCYHQAAIWGGFVSLVLTLLANIWHRGPNLRLQVKNFASRRSKSLKQRWLRKRSD